MTTTPILVAPSILAGDFSRLGDEVSRLEKSRADWIHFDVMDGHFVPNLTMGPELVRTLRGLTRLFFDVHLMVEQPEKVAPWFLAAGADLISFHLEAAKDPVALAASVRQQGKKVGVAVNPGTPAEGLAPLLTQIDLVLLMSVNPGFCGQAFSPGVLDKARWIRACAPAGFWIAMDGGVNQETGRLAREAGVNVLVAGNAVLKAGDYRVAIDGLRGRDGQKGPRLFQRRS